ncbi:MAG: hypothetical protein KKF65_00565, partial [Nanoarchaeota archaeon]|nr:hypothetical protein [Nanoarchaeota archaeon]
VGKTFFWLFYAGMIFVGVNISKKMKKHQDQIAFSIVWIIFISGILFSRISEGSLKNTDLEWLEGVGKLLFYLFCISLVCAGVYFRKFIKNPRIKNIFTISWVAVSFLTILVSISRSLILNNGELLINGTNLVSQLFYFGGAFLLLTVLLSIYFNEQIKIRSGLIITVSWLTFMLVSGRGAVRLFFMITPFVCFMVGYSVVNLYDYAKRSRRIKWLRVSLLSIFFIVIFAIFFSTIGYSVTHRTLCPNGISENAGQIAQIICTPDLYAQSTFQSKNTGPSANMQWQQAMSWVRENTNEGSIFIHWWDYGYWVQYLGERPTVTDGGHINSYWDHLIGRYLLTTPQPETALSLMKTHDVSYLLIDPTDLGKYGAYSSIGSGPDGNDRLSWIPTLLSDQSQMRETQNSTVRVFNGGVPLDGDIEYTKDGNTIFLPEGKAVLAGIILETTSQEGAIGLLQPEGVFIYNGNQINLPIKYIYYNGEIIEFEKGVEIILRVVTKVDIVGQNLQKDELGAIVYLSPKVAQGLFAQLYLMDDPFEKYPTLKIAHSEPDLFINHLRNQGFSLEEFVYYQGFRGPIKIWEVDYPSNIISKEEFLRVYGGWGEFDNLEFTN